MHSVTCRNRHCPKCQTLAKERWLAAQRAALLPIPYFHVVFTLPHALNALAQGNPRVVYALLFRAAAETLLAFGRDLLGQPPLVPPAPESVSRLVARLTGVALECCPICHVGRMVPTETFPPASARDPPVARSSASP